METITIQVANHQQAVTLLDLLKTLDFVTAIYINDEKLAPLITADNDFFAAAGLWAARDINLDAIRQQAWPKRQVSC